MMREAWARVFTRIDHIGVAVQEIEPALELYRDRLQLRVAHREVVAEQGVEVQIRSVFLNGLLFLPRENLPPALADAGPRLSRIRRILAEAGADPLQAALARTRKS